MRSLTSSSLPDTEKLAADWLAQVSLEDETDEATVVGLSGHLGSGKTTFVQAVAKTLGVNEIVTSPTFVIMKIYETGHSRFKRLVHIDAYRLESAAELEALDFEKIVADTHNLVLIEWAENVREALPENARWITLEATGDTKRKITL